MTTKINTWDLATERVERDGTTYKLDSASPIETSRHVPALIYDADEQTIRSEGGRKHDVTVRTYEDEQYDMPANATIDHRGRYPWTFGAGADAHQRARIQRSRALALIRHAVRE
jgi:hypothetical protein